MSFEFCASESVEAGIKRIVDEQLAAALDDLRDADSRKADAAVHSVRKRFKRVRAILRLVRDELGEATFAVENAHFRDTGGTLSEARDAAVLVLTLDSLKPAIDPVPFAAARKKLVARRRTIKNRVLQAQNGLEAVAAATQAARDRVAHWKIERDGWDAIKPGIRQIYGQARDACNTAEVGSDPHHFHDWRKRVKDLWHQTELLEPIWPPMLKELAAQFHALADLLGNEHDLTVLKDVLQAEAKARAADFSEVIDVIDQRRADLRKQAMTLGARLFAEKPKPFARRLAAYWTAWKREQAAPIQEEPKIDLTPAELEELREIAAEPTPPDQAVDLPADSDSGSNQDDSPAFTDQAKDSRYKPSDPPAPAAKSPPQTPAA